MIDSRAMLAAYVEYQANCEDSCAKRLRTRWEEVHWRPPRHLRILGCAMRESPKQKNCGTPECTDCNDGRRREHFRWASERWIDAYEELRGPTCLEFNQVLLFLDAIRR